MILDFHNAQVEWAPYPCPILLWSELPKSRKSELLSHCSLKDPFNFANSSLIAGLDCLICVLELISSQSFLVYVLGSGFSQIRFDKTD